LHARQALQGKFDRRGDVALDIERRKPRSLCCNEHLERRDVGVGIEGQTVHAHETDTDQQQDQHQHHGAAPQRRVNNFRDHVSGLLAFVWNGVLKEIGF
jgi:hypothetical protein